uniref:Uncharacterized protein n=1 Tax=Geladintestivirus 2 TaxID=3233134 RepID=A0AAU8MKJ4_9CAUD
MKENNNNKFTIKISSPVKNRRHSNTKNIISRKCYAIVIKDKEEWKAKIPLYNNIDENDAIIIPFTEESLSLKNKQYIFLHGKDNNNKDICIIRDSFKAYTQPGCKAQYKVFKEGMLISGYIVMINNIKYFEYETLIAFTEKGFHINEVDIDADKPLFKSSNANKKK